MRPLIKLLLISLSLFSINSYAYLQPAVKCYNINVIAKSEAFFTNAKGKQTLKPIGNYDAIYIYDDSSYNLAQREKNIIKYVELAYAHGGINIQEYGLITRYLDPLSNLDLFYKHVSVAFVLEHALNNDLSILKNCNYRLTNEFLAMLSALNYRPENGKLSDELFPQGDKLIYANELQKVPSFL